MSMIFERRVPQRIKAICFDAFGTLVEINDKRWPYRKLLTLAEAETRMLLAPRLMREPITLQYCLEQLGHKLSQSEADLLKSDLEAELTSIRLRPNTANMLETLKLKGYKIAVCSNLALPYGAPFLSALPITPDAIILSYEAGFIKPESGIYENVCQALSMKPDEVLFTGDTNKADVDGPIEFGMSAIHISEFEALFS